MTSANDLHPSLSELTAFDHGLLAPAEWRAVESHVSRCAECCARLEALPEDALTSLLRSSYLADTSPPDTAADATSFVVASSADAVAPVPPELTSHARDPP